MLGAFKWDPRFVVIAALGVILSAVYMLWMFQRVFYGKVTNDHNKGLPDLSFREWAIVGPLAAAAIGMGVAPERVPQADGAGHPAHRRSRPVAPADAGRGRVAEVHQADAASAGAAEAEGSRMPQGLKDLKASEVPAPRSLARGGAMMISGQFDAIIPMLCVALAGLVVLLAEAFRGKGEKMPIGGLAIIGLVGAGVGLDPAVGQRAPRSFGVVTADNFGLFVNLVLVGVGLLTVMFSSQTIERDRLPAGEYYAMMLFAHRRHDADGAGDRSAGDLPRARDHVDRGLRPDRHAPRSAAEHRSGVQVFPARRVRQLVLPLRHRVPLRRHRHHQHRQAVDDDCGAVDERQSDDPAGDRAC